MSDESPTPNEGAAETPAEASAAQPDPAAEVARLTAEAAAAQDKALRAQAETENVRRRMRREMEEDRRYAEQSLLTDLLPVLDNIGRATKAAETTKDVVSLLAGVEMVAQQLDTILKKHHCLRIEAAGAEFDPNLHQAISMQPRDDVPANSVVLVAQDGYQLHERVLRPAQVIVAMPTPAAAEAGN